MNYFGDHSRICAITSENTDTCVKSRGFYARKHKGVVSVNGQAHVIDLLIKDIGNKEWVKHVLIYVKQISDAVHSSQKLKALFTECPDVFNINVCQFHMKIRKQYFKKAYDFSENLLVKMQTSIMIKQQSKTRFISADGALESFCRAKYVLRDLIKQKEFSSVLGSPNKEKRMKKEQFVNVLEHSSTIFEKLSKLHSVLLVIRR